MPATAELPPAFVAQMAKQVEECANQEYYQLPSKLACVRFDGWRSYLNTQLVFSGERLARGVECRTQADFAYLARIYRVTL